MKAWDETVPLRVVDPPRPRPSAAPPDPRPPLDRVVGLFLDADVACRGDVPFASTVLVEGDSFSTTDPDYPGGFSAPADPNMLVALTEETARELAAIARDAAAARRRELDRLMPRIERAADRVATDLGASLGGEGTGSTFYDAGLCARGLAPRPCTRIEPGSADVVELGVLRSREPRHWTATILVGETAENREALANLARRVSAAYLTAAELGRRRAIRDARSRVQRTILEHGWSTAQGARREWPSDDRGHTEPT